MTEVESKLERVYDLMERENLDGVLLTQNSNIAWLTGGSNNRILYTSEEGAVKLLVLKNRIEVITNNIEKSRMMLEQGLTGKIYRFAENFWYEKEKLQEKIDDYRLGCDKYLPGTEDLAEQVKELRYSLLPVEIERYKKLGQKTSRLLTNLMKKIEPGQTENEIRGEMARMLWQENINPHLIMVGADNRVYNYRHPVTGNDEVEKYVMVVICAEQRGLIVNLTRLVHFGSLPENLKKRLESVARIEAGFILNTKVGTEVSEIFKKAVKMYADEGYEEEWKLHHQGGATGYESRDYLATPDIVKTVRDKQAFAWNPSIRGVKNEDTIIVNGDGFEIITEDPAWPMIETEYKGEIIKRPGILER